MKKLVFTAALLLASAVQAAVGVSGGLHFSNTELTSGSQVYTGSANLGYNISGVYTMPLGGYTLFTGAGYLVKESKSTISSVDATYTFGYIDIPVQIGMKVSDLIGLRGGLDLGLKLSEKCTVSTAGGTCDTQSGGTSFIYGLAFGLDFNINKDMSIDLNLGYGLSDLWARGSQKLTEKLNYGVAFTYFFM